MNVSDRLREALERLDQAIDRLDASATGETDAPVETGHTVPDNTAIVAAKLERMIQRIETALAN